ncbi:MAG: NAD(P)H-binding protein [Deltaproteobacteria bacterium]|jgi:uncharacterized protein YbjT (DUF2867 family)
MYAVTTPTGQVGHAVLARLLEAGADLRVIARSPDNAMVSAARGRGAGVVAGSLDDPEVLARAFDGVDAVFWLTPPSYDADDVVARYTQFGERAAQAIQRCGVPRVVHLSSFGAHLDAATGPIRGNRAVERALDATSADVLHLRPAYFMDNDLWSVASVREQGAFFFPVRGACRIPRIATRDVAEVAANALLDPSFTDQRTLELEGPRRVTFDEDARAIAQAIGAPVQHVTVPPTAAREAMANLGMSADAAARVVELYEALDAGVLGGAPPTPPLRTETTIEMFAREVFRPAYRAGAP